MRRENVLIGSYTYVQNGVRIGHMAMGYHYGQTIREHRQAKGMSLSKLAEKWPSKETGVTSRYVSDIERGVKHIQDVAVLRGLAALLDIPLWKFGLTEFNPFQDQVDMNVSFDSEAIEEILQDVWLIRQNISFDVFTEKVKKLSALFEKHKQRNPLLTTNKDFLRLCAHEQRLEETVYTERHIYSVALKCATKMLELAQVSGDSVATAIAYTRIGVELLRNEDRAAMQYLQKACNISLGLSKEI